jgi:hypothetical protein
MLETASSGGSPRPARILDSGLSARADETSRSQERGTRHRHGSLSRTRRRSARGVEEREPERRQPTVVLSGGESHPDPRRFVATGLDRAPARPAGAARNRPFEGSCSRSYRSGRSRTNGIVVVDARSTGRPRLRAEAKRSGGQPSPREGSPVRSKALWIIGTRFDRHGSRWAGGLGRALADSPLPRERGVSSGKRKPKEDRRSAVTGASEDEARSTSREETPAPKSRNRLHPKCVGRRETRHASARVTPPDHRTSRGCPSSKCRWQKAGRTHLWSMTVAFVVKCGRKPYGNGVRGSI